MVEFKKDVLREYIRNSEIRVFSNNIKVRLNKELAIKYDKGLYNKFLKYMDKCYKALFDLNISYPGNAKPVIYFYIVPDDNFAKLLNYPDKFNNGKGGGKPVNCYDLDGFSSAFGISQNIAEYFKEIDNIAGYENDIHELSHLVCSNFFRGSCFLGEGMAETIPLYILNLEDKYLIHKETLINLKEEQILTVEKLLNEEENDTFGVKELLPNKTCSFRLSYISSYLFVRGVLESIEENQKLDKIKSLQYFLEMLYTSKYMNVWLVYDIADTLGLNREELLSGKSLQMKVLNNIKNS